MRPTWHQPLLCMTPFTPTVDWRLSQRRGISQFCPFAVGIALALLGIICPPVGIALAFISEQMKGIKVIQIRAIVGFPAFRSYSWN